LSQFVGSHTFSVSDKGRFNVPSPVRQGLSPSADDTFVISPGPDGCLDVYPLDEWNRRARVFRKIPNKRMGRYYKRRILGGAVRCRMDAHNRILVPPDLLKSVGIEKRILIVGQNDHLEFWNPDTHQSYMKKQDVSLEDVLEEIEDQLHANGSSSQE